MKMFGRVIHNFILFFGGFLQWNFYGPGKNCPSTINPKITISIKFH
jgi:hypothetical protein